MTDRLPFMPVETGEYLTGTGHLTTEQHGANLLLRIHYWNNGQLPDNDVQLAAIVHLPLKNWKAMRSTLAAFFGPGFSSHEWLDKERERTRKIQADRRNAGSMGGVESARRRRGLNLQVMDFEASRAERHSAAQAALKQRSSSAQPPLPIPIQKPLLRPEQEAPRAREAGKPPHEATKQELDAMFEQKRSKPADDKEPPK